MGSFWYNFLNKLLVIYERVFRNWLQAKMDDYMQCCVYLIDMHNIVYYQSNMTNDVNMIIMCIRKYCYQTFTRHKPAPCFKQNSLRNNNVYWYAIFTNITNYILCLTQDQCFKSARKWFIDTFSVSGSPRKYGRISRVMYYLVFGLVYAW